MVDFVFDQDRLERRSMFALCLKTEQNSAMRNTEAAFTWIVEVLRKHGVPFRISGGFAARLYGSTRELADIDFDIPENRFEELVSEVQPYITYGPAQYIDDKWNVKLMTLEYKGQVIDLAGSYEIQIFNRITEQWELSASDLEDAVMIDAYGIEVPVTPKEELIAYKKQVLREVDVADIATLQK
jgi:hypothetical protein